MTAPAQALAPMPRPRAAADPLARLEADVAALERAALLIERRDRLRERLTAQGVAHADAVMMAETMAQICEAVAWAFMVTPADLRGEACQREIAWPRQVACFIMASRCRWSLPNIGRFMGGRHHSTVIHARNKVGRYLDAALAAAGFEPDPSTGAPQPGRLEPAP